MGTWGHGSFENDDALDWVSELESAEDTEPITAAFEEVLSAEDYLEAPEAASALSAAEVVAALLGRPAAELPDEVRVWVTGKEPPEAELVELAGEVVKRVLSASELKDLWAEGDQLAMWQAEVEGLLRRLDAGTA